MEEKTKTVGEIMAEIANRSKITKDNFDQTGKAFRYEKVETIPYQVYNQHLSKPIYYATIDPTCRANSRKSEIKAETFAYKAPEYKYYISAETKRPYKAFGKELILRKNLTDGQFAEVYSDKSVKECCKDDTEYYERMLSNGEFMDSPKELTNRILGIVENGYYVPKNHPNGFGKGKNKYCLERSDLGWESVIVSGRNPNITHLAGTNEAKECDEFVKLGDWVLVEVVEVVES